MQGSTWRSSCGLRRLLTVKVFTSPTIPCILASVWGVSDGCCLGSALAEQSPHCRWATTAGAAQNAASTPALPMNGMELPALIPPG